MKKTITLLFVTITSLLLFSSCDKNKDQEKEFSLVGTTWIGETSANDFHVFRFTSTADVEYTLRHGSATGSISGEPEFGTFELGYPTLTIFINNGVSINVWNCTFINEQMFRAKDYYQHLVEFREQQ